MLNELYLLSESIRAGGVSTGCSAEDIELFQCTLLYLYDLNRSAIRPDVRIRHAWYIEHKSILGSCPEYLLLEALTPERIGEARDPSDSWRDYVDKTALPEELRNKVASCRDLIDS